MSAIRDVKSFGLPPERKPMPAPVRAACGAMLILIVLGTAWSLVADEPDRKAVTINEPTITLTEQEFAEVLEAARADGMKAGIAQKQCRPGDEFTYPPRRRTTS